LVWDQGVAGSNPVFSTIFVLNLLYKGLHYIMQSVFLFLFS